MRTTSDGHCVSVAEREMITSCYLMILQFISSLQPWYSVRAGGGCCVSVVDLGFPSHCLNGFCPSQSAVLPPAPNNATIVCDLLNCILSFIPIRRKAARRLRCVIKWRQNINSCSVCFDGYLRLKSVCKLMRWDAVVCIRLINDSSVFWILMSTSTQDDHEKVKNK